MPNRVFFIDILFILVGTFFISIPTVIHKDMKGDRVGALLTIGWVLLFMAWLLSIEFS